MRPSCLLTGSLLVLTLAGCTGTTGGQGLYLGSGPGSPTTSPTSASSSAPSTTSESETTSAEPTTTSNAPTTTTSAPPPPPPPTSSSPPPTGGQLSDDQWVVESFEYNDGGIGLFAGTARIRNDADASRSALYTFTLFDGETIVATFIGSSSEVAAGDSVTVSLISGDDFVDGEFSVDFQVDFSF